MIYGIIDESKKFLLLDENRSQLRGTALMLLKCVDDEWGPMFDENTVDEAIKEYEDTDIEVAYNGDKYIKSYAPAIDNEYQSKMREKAYEKEVDPITAHISRLRDEDPESPDIATLIAERTAKREEIKKRYPYSE